MFIPKILFGTYKEVKTQCQAMLKRIIRGETISQVLGNLPMIDTRENSGNIILLREARDASGQSQHYMMFLLQQEFSKLRYSSLSTLPKKQLTLEQTEQFCSEILNYPWGVICSICRPFSIEFLGYPLDGELSKVDQWKALSAKPKTKSLLCHWSVISEVSDRYVSGYSPPGDLASQYLLTLLPSILSKFGISEDMLRKASASNEEVLALLEQVSNE